MEREFSPEEAARHSALVDQAQRLVGRRLLLHERPGPTTLGWYARWQLKRAIRCYTDALRINPEGWPSMWMLGKIHQRLGDHNAAFEWFNRAHRLNPEQPDVAREASIAALDTGRKSEALALCHAALAAKPEDAGLVCNLALAYCLAGRDDEAQQCAAEAVARDPNDTISANVLSVVTQVAQGKRPRPTRLGLEFS